ncbi:hypothetical protein BLA29_011249, partial [Euroglyphus maynei]
MTEIRLLKQLQRIEHVEIQGLSDQYYHTCCAIIENGQVSKENEAQFEESRTKVDMVYKYSDRISMVEKCLEKSTLTNDDIGRIDAKLTELRHMELTYPHISCKIDEIVNRYNCMKANASNETVALMTWDDQPNSYSGGWSGGAKVAA